MKGSYTSLIRSVVYIMEKLSKALIYHIACERSKADGKNCNRTSIIDLLY